MRLLALMIGTVLLIGCASKPVESEAELQARLLALPENAPLWIHTPDDLPERMGASGAALPMQAGLQFQQIEANARAKERLMDRINIQTQHAALALYEAMGVDVGSEALRTMGMMTASGAIGYAKRTHLWWAPSNELYLHLTLDRRIAKGVAMENIRLYVRSIDEHDAAYRALAQPQLLRTLCAEVFGVE